MKTIKWCVLLMLLPFVSGAAGTNIGGGQIWPEFTAINVDSLWVWTYLDLSTKSPTIVWPGTLTFTNIAVDSVDTQHLVVDVGATSAGYFSMDSLDTQHAVVDIGLTSAGYASVDSVDAQHGVFDVGLTSAGYAAVDSVNTNHLVVNTTTDLLTDLVTIGAGTAGDQDIILRFAESDNTEDFFWNDGSSRFETTAALHGGGTISTSGGVTGSTFTGATSVRTPTYHGNPHASGDILIDPDSDGAGTTLLGNAEADTARIQTADLFDCEGRATFDSTITLAEELTLAEVTTPSAVENFGKIYTKDDNQLYFQDGAGAEHVVSVGGSDYGEMGNVYGSSATEVLGEADQWYAMYHANITGSAPHLNSGFTFTAGQIGVIASVSDASAGDVWIVDAGCNLTAGDYVTINGCTDANYNGAFEVKSVDVDSFTVTATWGATDTGAWQEGSYLECNTAGIYRGIWNSSFSQSLTNSRTTIVTPFVNTTQSTKATSSQVLGNATDIKRLGGGGLMSFSVGDRRWFAAQTSAAQTLTFLIRNVTIH